MSTDAEVKVKLARASDGYRAHDGRFVILRNPGRSYTRGPFHNYWDIEDNETGKRQIGLYSLNDVRIWITRALNTRE